MGAAGKTRSVGFPQTLWEMRSVGMVICKGRLDELAPLENVSMPGRVVIQSDKDDCGG